MLLATILLLIGACAATEPVSPIDSVEAKLPEVPPRRGPLSVHLEYPAPGAAWLVVDSTFLFGTVGNGQAHLTINDEPVEVASNGAFLAFMRIPSDGTFHFEAELDGRIDRETFTYAPPEPLPPADTTLVEYTVPQLARVVVGKDTLDSGSEIASAAPTPDGDRRWFFPFGARVVITGQRGPQYRIHLTDSTEAWLDTSAVTLGQVGGYEPALVGRVRIQPQAGYTDVILPVDFAPFLVDAQVRHLDVTVYGRAASPEDTAPSGIVQGAEWVSSSMDSSTLFLDLSEGLWGFKAFYDPEGNLVVRVRHAPEIDPSDPLRGLRIMLDPGHPPGGAVGPTGLKEDEANLSISLRIANMLRDRGAVVLMTRTTPEPLVSDTSAAEELWARTDTAVALNADMLIAVHNNAFPDGVNPFENFGTETYYFHPFSAPLAQELLREIWGVTGIPNLGAQQRSLALVRPTWLPSTLTESLFMMFPRQEAALRNPEFLDRLASAHVEGIMRFLQRYLELSTN